MWHRFHYPVCRLLEGWREVTTYPGSHFTAVAPMIAIGKAASTPLEGLLQIYGAVIVAGIVTFLIAPYYSRLLHLFPPVHRYSDHDHRRYFDPGGYPERWRRRPNSSGFRKPQEFWVRGRNLGANPMIYRFSRGFMSSIAVLLGLVVGTAVAAAFGLVDFSGVAKAGWLDDHAIPLWTANL